MDPNGFAARFEEQLHKCGPPSWPSLFASRADVAAAQRLIADPALAQSDAELKAAKLLVAAVCHPDTGRVIPVPFRMSAHVPVNTVLLIGMLGATTPLGTAGWQWLNATFNLLQFFANRNASNVVTNEQIAASYLAAMSISVAVGAGFRALAIRAAAATAHLPSAAPSRRAAYIGGASVAFLAAAAGKPAQIGLMRSDEFTRGINTFDDDGLPRGSSRAAGRAAVTLTVATRIIYLLPMLWLPLIRDFMFARLPSLAASRLKGGAAYAAIVALHSAYATPACMALFGHRTWLEPGALEPEFRGLSLASSREPVTKLWFNKGL